MGGHDLAWMRSHLPQDNSVNIADISSSSCCLGLWRPLAPKVVSEVLDADSDKSLTSFTARQVYLDTIPALAVGVCWRIRLGDLRPY